MSIPTIRENIRIDKAKQTLDTKNNTFLDGMKLSEFRIHVAISLNKKQSNNS